jgi:hypothetical protein
VGFRVKFLLISVISGKIMSIGNHILVLVGKPNLRTTMEVMIAVMYAATVFHAQFPNGQFGLKAA